MDFNSIIAKRVRDKDPQGYGIIAQLGEHLPYKQRVIGSSPIGPIYIAIPLLPGLPIPRNLSLLPRQKVPLLFSKTNSITLPMVVKPL